MVEVRQGQSHRGRKANSERGIENKSLDGVLEEKLSRYGHPIHQGQHKMDKMEGGSGWEDRKEPLAGEVLPRGCQPSSSIPSSPVSLACSAVRPIRMPERRGHP
ncbi:hypothetical protein H8959_010473 [Pygathrix nigripes]